MNTAQRDELYKWQRSKQSNAAMKASKATNNGGENNTTNKGMTRKQLRATIASLEQPKNASEGGGNSSTKDKAEISDASGITLDHPKTMIAIATATSSSKEDSNKKREKADEDPRIAATLAI
jgi:hypothetical protein